MAWGSLSCGLVVVSSSRGGGVASWWCSSSERRLTLSFAVWLPRHWQQRRGTCSRVNEERKGGEYSFRMKTMNDN